MLVNVSMANFSGKKRTSFCLFVIGSFNVGFLFVLIELLYYSPRGVL